VKIRKYDGGDLRRVLCGMVTDQTVLSRIASQWKAGGLFDARYANLVGGWCVNHLEKYGTCPNGELKSIFEEWASKPNVDEKTSAHIEKFLIELSDDHDAEREKPNSDYLLDVAGRLFNKIQMRAMVREVEDDLDFNRIEDAHGKLSGLMRVELGVGTTVKLSTDYEAWREALNPERRRSLISYPDQLDGFLGKWMVRESLYAFMAPDKTGKTMWLIDAAYRAVRNRCRVGYVDAGDMGQKEAIMRMGQRTLRRSWEAETIKWPTRVSIDEEIEIVSEEREFDDALDPGRAFRAFQKLSRKKDMFRLTCHPNSSINVAGIESIVRDWCREGWTPDVLIIDYADILSPPTGIRESLDQIDATWKHLRRLSQEFHCLVLTATQSNATAYGGQRTLGRQHFSGRKTKLAHVNGMIGLNVSPEDKEKGLTRVNWVVRREGKYNERYGLPVAGCFAAACPAVRSLGGR